MKIFCMACGKKNEYIGESNKPSQCSFCSQSFGNGVSPPPQQKKDKFAKSRESYFIEGTKFDRNFLLNLITFEREDDQTDIRRQNSDN